ncbi:MAG: hypothetical protein IJZ35_04185 [Clostridia bacterium]|nr:hypothetical protein [Clostridia bacterium]
MSAEEKAKKSAVIVKTGEQVTISNIVEKTDSGIIAELTNGKKVYISTGAGKTQMLIPLQALILSVLTMMIFVTVLLVIKFS